MNGGNKPRITRSSVEILEPTAIAFSFPSPCFLPHEDANA